MAEFKGSVPVPGGLKPLGTSGFPIVNAPDIQVDDEGTRLDEKLKELDDNLSIITEGVTFTPNVSSDGVLSWSNDKNLENPNPVNIKGPKGGLGAVMKVVSEGDDVSVNPFEKYRIKTEMLESGEMEVHGTTLMMGSCNIACAALGDYIYMLGGRLLESGDSGGSAETYHTINSLQKYNTVRGGVINSSVSWPLYNGESLEKVVSMASNGSRIYVIYKNTEGNIASGYIDPRNGVESSGRELPKANFSKLPRVAVVDKCIYMFGANDTGNVFKYDPAKGTASEPTVVSTIDTFDGNAPCAAVDSKIYLFNQYEIGIFDTKSNEFTKIQSRIDLTGSDLNAVEAVSVGSNIYLFDGTTTIKMFDTKSQESFTLSDVSLETTQVYRPGVVALGNRIYIIGGGEDEDILSWDIYSFHAAPYPEVGLALTYSDSDYSLLIDAYDNYCDYFDFEILNIQPEYGNTTVVYSLNGVRDKCTILNVEIPAEECQLKISTPKQVALYNTTVAFGGVVSIKLTDDGNGNVTLEVI